MAHTKAQGSVKTGRDSEAKRLGVKLFDGQMAKIGSIIVRQRGTKIAPGANVKKGQDDTLFAVVAGHVKFTSRTKKLFNGKSRPIKVANIVA